MAKRSFIHWLWKWLKDHNLSLTSSISAIGIFFIIYQLHQSYSYKKYDNFLYFNKVYDEWYDDMPSEISRNEQTSFDDLDGSGKAWVRRYFNLYAQEYYFSRESMIPVEMWEELVHGCKDGKIKAAFSNLKKYPALLQGYVCWAQDGDGFGFPEDFIYMLNKELKKCSIKIPDIKNCS